MTETDEALLWAREDYAKQFRSRRSHVADSILSGYWDIEVEVSLPAHGYRAGAAASAERIKELEAALRSVVDDYDWVRDGPGDRDWNVLDNTIIRARALLKDPDQ